MIDDALIDQARKAPLPAIIAQTVELVRAGSGFSCCCPFHDDTNPSMSVYRDPDGEWNFHCHACGVGGDAIQWYRLSNKLDFPDAVRAVLTGISAIPPEVIKKTKTSPKKQTGSVVMPVPDDAPPPPKSRRASHQFIYRDRKGRVLMAIERIPQDDGRKIFQQLSYRRHNDGTHRWEWVSVPSNRPLYGLDRLGDGKPVVLVEGEGKADAAQAALPDHAILSWPGGANGIAKVDFSPLEGIDFTIWPDADEPGIKAARAIQERLPRGKVVPVSDRPAGWDVGDAVKEGWSPEQLKAMISRAKPTFNPRIVASDGELVDPGALPPAVPDLPENPYPSFLKKGGPIKEIQWPFRILGHTKKGVAYYHPKRGLIIYTPPAHNQGGLGWLAPLNFWKEIGFSSQGDKLDVAAINDRLWTEADNEGHVDLADIMRGVGAWIDNDKPVLHLGDRLIDHELREHNPATFASKFIYTQAQGCWRGIREAPLDVKRATAFFDLCSRAPWRDSRSAVCFAGWVAMGAVSGALPWRPHIWVRGPAGSGKSSLFNQIAMPMLDALAVSVVGAVTDAAIRQNVDGGAVPILYDEAEVMGDAGAREVERIGRIMFMARSCSSNTEARQRRYGEDSVDFPSKSAFYCTSIGTSLRTQPDETRWTVLTLDNAASKISSVNDAFSRWQSDCCAMITPQFSYAMAMRFLSRWDVLMHNREVFKRAITDHLGSGRIGDQVGMLYASACLLKSDNRISDKAAREWVARENWEEQNSILTETDEFRLLRAITDSTFQAPIGGSNGPHFVGSLLETARAAIREKPTEYNRLHSELFTRLRERGLRCRAEGVDIVIGQKALQTWLKDSSYANMNYGEILQSLPGASKGKGAVIPSHRNDTYVTIPWEVFFPDAQK